MDTFGCNNTVLYCDLAAEALMWDLNDCPTQETTKDPHSGTTEVTEVENQTTKDEGESTTEDQDYSGAVNIISFNVLSWTVLLLLIN